jgi:hypothetical protein
MRKHKINLIFIFILVFGFSQSISGQILSEGLEELSKVRILVENLGSILENTGLTSQQLENEAELRLRRVGLYLTPPPVKSSSSSDTYDDLVKSVNYLKTPYLYININAIEIDNNTISFSTKVTLNQDVILERNNNISLTATTWEKGWIGKTPKTGASPYIRELVAKMVDQFIEDWKKANRNSSNKTKESNPLSKTQENSPFKAVYVGGNRPPEVEVFNDSDRTLYLDLGQNKLIPYTIPPKTSKTFNLTNGFYNFKATAPRVVPLEGQQEFKKGYKYSWRFTIVKYTVPR